MQVFKTFIKIAKKNMGVSIMYFTMFTIIMISMSSMAMKDQATDFKSQSISLAISDEDDSAASNGLIKYLSKQHKIVKLRSYDNETIQDNIFFSKIQYYLEIPKGFEKALLENQKEDILYNAKQKNQAYGFFMDQQIENYVSSLFLYITGGYTMDKALSATNSDFENLPEVELINSTKENTNPKEQHMFFFFQYAPYISLCVLLLGMSPILLAFHRKDLEQRISSSAFPYKKRSFQLFAGCASYSILLWIVFIITAGFVYDFQNVFSEKGLLCSINCFMFIILSTSITLLISTFSLNKNALNMVTNIVTLSMSFLCGVFVPQWYLSKGTLTFGKFLPAYWYIKNNNMIGGFVDEPFTSKTYFTNLSIQFMFGIAVFLLFFLRSKQKKQNQL